MDDPKPGAARILVVDDEPVVRLSCSRILITAGHIVDTEARPEAGLEAALTGRYDLVLLDMVMPGMDGLELLRRLRAAGSGVEVVIITGYSTVQTAVEAMRAGAGDYVAKPFTPDELRVVVGRALDRSALLRENAVLRAQLAQEGGFEGIVGRSSAMEEVFRLIRRIAPADGTVLVTGASGTGKEMVALALHRLSPRRGRAFVACDCSALAPTLLESELFGHVKGAFSGAVATKQGLFSAAHHGTLFLDETGNLAPDIQAKLLRVLETRRLKRVGDTAELEVDLRLVAASNRDLGTLVEEGTFRADLYYRLNVLPIRLPPLRERDGDVPLLAMTFLERARREGRSEVGGFTPEAMALLEAWSWPGNVRELRNVVERLAVLCDADRIQPCHLPVELREPPPASRVSRLPECWDDFKRLKREVRESTVDDLERRFLEESLARHDGNVSRTAEAIGIQRTNLHALLKKHGLGGDE